MNKEGFNKLVSDYSDVKDQFNELEKLVHQYPYSQPVRMLNVKSSSTLSKVEYQKRLGLAAFYSTDRNVLRSLVETGHVPSDVVVQKKKSVVEKKTPPPLKKTTAKKVVPAKKSPKVDVDILRTEVLHNLDELMKSKAHFMELIDEPLPELRSEPSKPTKEVVKKSVAKEKPSQPKAKTGSEKPIASKPVSKPPIKSAKAKPATKPQSRTRTNKDKLIDKFIEDAPSITPNQSAKENQSDLSKASSELKEDLVSENLAEIFAGQGKTSKAIEIYKKLIWKFPQKKASFAARIEELKKK